MTLETLQSAATIIAYSIVAITPIVWGVARFIIWLSNMHFRLESLANSTDSTFEQVADKHEKLTELLFNVTQELHKLRARDQEIMPTIVQIQERVRLHRHYESGEAEL